MIYKVINNTRNNNNNINHFSKREKDWERIYKGRKT